MELLIDVDRRNRCVPTSKSTLVGSGMTNRDSSSSASMMSLRDGVSAMGCGPSSAHTRSRIEPCGRNSQRTKDSPT
jgi:hypothetical protein